MRPFGERSPTSPPVRSGTCAGSASSPGLAMAARTPNTVDDALVKLLKQAHERVETVEQRINKFIPDLSEAMARAEAAIEAAAKVATASVPGSGAVIAAAQAAVEAAKRDSEAKSSGS